MHVTPSTAQHPARCVCLGPANVTEFPAGFGHNYGLLSVTPARRRGAQRVEGERTTMATDYDSPRKTDDDLTEDSLQELQARRMDQVVEHGRHRPGRGS